MNDILTPAAWLSPIVVALFTLVGTVIVAHMKRRPIPPTPLQEEDATIARLNSIVDVLHDELERRDRMQAAQMDELRRLRTEVDVLHRLVSACYRILTEHGLEPPAYPHTALGGD